MRRFLTMIFFAGFFCTTLPVTGNAFFFNNAVDKAKEFEQANMVPQAVEILQKEIQENPTNAEAHFELGCIYLRQGDFSGADERFRGAVSLKSGTYNGQIGTLCTQAGFSYLDKHDQDSAIRSFDIAVEFNPHLKKELGQQLFDRGMAALEGITQNADSSTSETV